MIKIEQNVKRRKLFNLSNCVVNDNITVVLKLGKKLTLRFKCNESKQISQFNLETAKIIE